MSKVVRSERCIEQGADAMATFEQPVADRSVTAQAQHVFLQRVVQVPEVCQVATYGSGTAAERSVVVVVPSLRSEAADRVFELEGDILRQFPQARLQIEIEALQELGLTSADLPARLPKDAEILL